MRVISVVGNSGSGKTTFIRALIPHLTRFGPVGTLKHTGHHCMELPKGKDTTLMFEAGAQSVTGIDSGKILVTLRSTSVTEALDLLAGRETEIAVIEGFKDSMLPKIVIGDLEIERCILRNPTVDEVIMNMDKFPEYVTLEEMLRKIRKIPGSPSSTPHYLTYSRELSFSISNFQVADLEQTLRKLEESTGSQPGILAVRAGILNGDLFGSSKELLVAIAAADGETGALALTEIVKEFRNLGDRTTEKKESGI